MLLIETLVEDRSGGVILDHILRKILDARTAPWVHHVYPHRGTGRFPRNPYEKPLSSETTLLPLLGAKLRAYRSVQQADLVLIVVVVMDSDAHPPEELFDKLMGICRREGRELPIILGLATEELEAWLLGDRRAILTAYPEADCTLLDAYEQDSVCGTWELLCHALLKEQAPRLIEIGYPAVGQYKYEWAGKIAPHLDLSRNRSPSFKRFHSYLERGLEIYEKYSG